MTEARAAALEPCGIHSRRDYRERIHTAFDSNGTLDISQGDPLRWMETIDEFLSSGRLETARFALMHLREQAPDMEWPKTLLQLVELMPDWPMDGPRFIDDRHSDLQVIACPGARTVVMAFCGRRGQLNMPLWLLQRWMTRREISVVYLRDFQESMYLRGLRSCGPLETTVERLKRVTEHVKAERIVCIGNSSGGYGALRYGLELGAARVFAFSGAVNMAPAFNTFLNKADAALRLSKAFPTATLDLRELYLAAARRPEAELFYGAKNWDDRIQAEHMIGVPGAALRPIPGYAGHAALPELIRLGQFDALLDRMASADGEP
jgi:hypothetical protein